MAAMDYDPRVVSACDELRQPCRYGTRTVKPNVIIAWWTYDNSAYSAVASGPRGRSIVKSTGYRHTAQEAALAAYVRGDLATYDEESEWNTL